MIMTSQSGEESPPPCDWDVLLFLLCDVGGAVLLRAVVFLVGDKDGRD